MPRLIQLTDLLGRPRWYNATQIEELVRIDQGTEYSFTKVEFVSRDVAHVRETPEEIRRRVLDIS